jgi:hypothetical protein
MRLVWQVGRDKVSDAADYRVASLHELPKVVPELFLPRPSAAVADGVPLENGVTNGVSPAAPDADRQHGLQRLVTGASLDEADLTVQEAMEVQQPFQQPLQQPDRLAVTFNTYCQCGRLQHCGECRWKSCD